MRIYLDTCSLQRPLDDRSQLRIRMEAEAILAILGLCETGALRMVSSEALELEVAKNPLPQRRVFAVETMKLADEVVEINDIIVNRAKLLEQQGFKGMDALHIAAAESGNVEFFCSCDDRLVRRAKSLVDLTLRFGTPLELLEEITR